MDYTPMIRDLPQSERPRERLRDYGPAALSTAELLAIILRSGSAGESVLAMATRLLAHFQGLAGVARAGFGELTAAKGLGEAKAAELKAALELGRRVAMLGEDEGRPITSSRDVANLLMAEMGMLEQESLRTLLLNTKHIIMAPTAEVVRGSVNSAQVRIGEIFKEAVRRNASFMIIAHNHPSGDPSPSADDIAITRDAAAAGKLLGIGVLDHVIIGRGRYLSMREHHLGFLD